MSKYIAGTGGKYRGCIWESLVGWWVETAGGGSGSGGGGGGGGGAKLI